MNLLMHGGFGSLISTFQEIWDTLGLPALPALQELDVEQLIESTMESIETQIKNAPQDAKEALQKEAMTQLESISIAGFSLIDLLGGEIENNLQIDDYDKERLKEKARQFAEDWETYLLKEWMQTVTGFFSAIGLGALTEWTSFNFCQFLTLIGFNPITITLPTSVSTVAASAGVSLPTLPVVNDTSGE
jgi:energy-converting hydrogenase Eha subunit H